MNILFVYGFVFLLVFGMHVTWPVKYRGGGGKNRE